MPRCGPIIAIGEGREEPLQGVQSSRAGGAQSALGDGLDQGAVGGVGKVRAPPGTLLGHLGQFGEGAEDVRGVDVPEPE